MNAETSSQAGVPPKPKLFIKHLQPYDALKLNCETRRNLGTLETPFLGGGHAGTLNATQDLIDLIAHAGGNIQGEPGFVPAQHGQMRRCVGTGHIGWKDFGSHAAAIKYLEKYFDLSECPPADSLAASAPMRKRPLKEPTQAGSLGAVSPAAVASASTSADGCSTNDLERLGFLNIAEWILNEAKLQAVGDDADVWKALTKEERALYAFCHDSKVLYIGKTTRSIKKRFMGYCSPGEGKSTNKKCHKEIWRLLGLRKSVRILVFPDTAKLQWDGFRINLAAGLEDALVDHFRPPLNGNGGEEFVTTTAEDEKQAEDGKS